VDFPSSSCALSALLSLPPSRLFLSPTLPFRNQIYSTAGSAPRDGIGRSATTGAHRAARIHRCGLLGPLTVRFDGGGIIQPVARVHKHATSVADVWGTRDEGFVGLLRPSPRRALHRGCDIFALTGTVGARERMLKCIVALASADVYHVVFSLLYVAVRSCLVSMRIVSYSLSSTQQHTAARANAWRVEEERRRWAQRSSMRAPRGGRWLCLHGLNGDFRLAGVRRSRPCHAGKKMKWHTMITQMPFYCITCINIQWWFGQKTGIIVSSEIV
jgi:hypothetical protein